MLNEFEKFENLSEFISGKNFNEFVLGCLMSRVCFSDNNKFIYTYYCFKKSKKVPDNINQMWFNESNNVEKLCLKLNSLTNSSNWYIKSITNSEIKLVYALKNDLNYSYYDLFENIYKILIEKIHKKNDDESYSYFKNNFIRGFFESRGSIDTKFNFVTQDYFFNEIDLKKSMMLFNLLDVPLNALNFNFRELQGDYISGRRKRNTQLRINLNYYSEKIGFLNEYKSKIVECELGFNPTIKNNIYFFELEWNNSFNSDKFSKYLNFFMNNIFKKKLDSHTINTYKKKLGFDKEPEKYNRSKLERDIFYNETYDICSLCKIEKTFPKKDGNQYFEVHHFIPLHNDSSLDIALNMIKLCSNCHKIFKKGVSDKKFQLEKIAEILKNYEYILDFSSSYFGIDRKNIELISIAIQKSLG